MQRDPSVHAADYRPSAGDERNRLGWAGFVLAVCGLLLFWIPMVYPTVGIVAIVVSAIGYSNARAGNATNGKWALAGIVLGVVSVVLPVVVLLGVATLILSGS